MSFTRTSRRIAHSAIGIALISGINLAFTSAASLETRSAAQATPKPTGGKCPAGYVVKGDACEDVNECATNNGGCAEGTECVNTPGLWQCGTSCPPGFTGTLGSCQDINECTTGNGGCDTLTMCTNTPGGRTCGECPDGHQGDGYIGCVDVNDCADGDCSAILERRARQRDSIPPVISTSGDVTVDANSSAGAVVNFKVTAKDNVDGEVPVQCAPASGSTFVVGATKVTCTAADKRGNKGIATITVNVVPPR